MPSAGTAARTAVNNQAPAAAAIILAKVALAASASMTPAIPAPPASAAITSTATVPASAPAQKQSPRAAPETTLARAAVRFASDTAALTDVDRSKLRQMRPLLAAASRIRITGFTDAHGGQEPNDRLASHRVLAVVLFLRDDLQISGSHVIGTGRPLCCYRAHNTDEAGRAVNRRAELDIELPADARSDQLIKQHASRLEPAHGTGNPA